MALPDEVGLRLARCPVRGAVDATGDPLEVSLDENVVRSPMNAAEQFELAAYVVRQRMRFVGVRPLLMEKHRDGELTLHSRGGSTASATCGERAASRPSKLRLPPMLPRPGARIVLPALASAQNQ